MDSNRLKRTKRDRLERLGLICTLCGARSQPLLANHKDLERAVHAGDRLPPTIESVCLKCSADLNDTDALTTLHFVDTLHR